MQRRLVTSGHLSLHECCRLAHTPSLCSCGANTSTVALVLLPDISTHRASSARFENEQWPACFAAAPTVLAQSSCSSSWKDALDLLCRHQGFGICVSDRCRQRHAAVLDHGTQRAKPKQIMCLDLSGMLHHPHAVASSISFKSSSRIICVMLWFTMSYNCPLSIWHFSLVPTASIREKEREREREERERGSGREGKEYREGEEEKDNNR